VFVYRDLSLKDVPKVLLNSANLSAMLPYIITNAVLSRSYAHENIPRRWRLDPRQELGTTAFCVATMRPAARGTSWTHVHHPHLRAHPPAPAAMPPAIRHRGHFGYWIDANMEVACAQPAGRAHLTSRAAYPE